MYLRKIFPFLVLAPLLLSQPSSAEEMSLRIINGVKSDSGSWPFMVALVSKNRDVYNGQFCGASFLGGRYILTAAHCVATKEAQDLDAVIGISALTQDDVAEHRYSIKEIYIHENYLNASSGNDIAILELDKEVDYTAVNLADKSLRPNLSPGVILTVMGWGDQDPDRETKLFKSELYQVNVPLVEQNLCLNHVDLNDNAFCAGYEDGVYDACHGDSGGPIVFYNDSTYKQLGIVSWGDGCAEAGHYGFYANVSYFVDWISEKTQGFSYRQSEFVGAKSVGTYSHSFYIRNNTKQVIRTSGVMVQGSDYSIKSNDCSVIEIDGSCEITIDYRVRELDFGKVLVRMSTDHAQTPDFGIAVSYIGIQSAAISVSDMISIANSNVYSSANSWVKNDRSIQTPVLGNNELSQLTITDLAAGRLSFDANIDTELGHDIFSIYVNGHLYKRLSGLEVGKLTINLPRDNNTVVFEYKKNMDISVGDDRVTISNFAYSTGVQSVIPGGNSIIPSGNSIERSSGGSGGAINWLTVLSLGMLALVRRRFSS